MRLSRKCMYALQAITFIAGHKGNGTIASHVIAEKRDISNRFLLKVLQPLVLADLLISVKGPQGGYRLSRPAERISVLEVFEAIEGPIDGHVPVTEKQANNSVNKKLGVICGQVAEQVRRVLSAVTLVELSLKD